MRRVEGVSIHFGLTVYICVYILVNVYCIYVFVVVLFFNDNNAPLRSSGQCQFLIRTLVYLLRDSLNMQTDDDKREMILFSGGWVYTALTASVCLRPRSALTTASIVMMFSRAVTEYQLGAADSWPLAHRLMCVQPQSQVFIVNI